MDYYVWSCGKTLNRKWDFMNCDSMLRCEGLIMCLMFGLGYKFAYSLKNKSFME